MLKLIDSSPYQQQPAATRLRYLTYYTTLSSQPKMKYLARSFQCWFLALCKGIVENNSRFPKAPIPYLGMTL